MVEDLSQFKAKQDLFRLLGQLFFVPLCYQSQTREVNVWERENEGVLSVEEVKNTFMMFFFFLSILIPDEVCGEEDHEDSEYNFMAEDQREEKEEYRNDRAVRIPRK